jgi:hypothetical protein
LTFALVSRRASGIPRASTTRWRLQPARPLSVGFGPKMSPPSWPPPLNCR